MKKLLLLTTLLLTSLTLSACGEETPEETYVGESPVFQAVEDIEVTIGETINVLSGVTATDVEDGDVTESISITNASELPLTGSIASTVGVFTINYYVKDSDNNETTLERSITVLEAIVEETNCTVDMEGMTITFCDDFLEAENANAQGVNLDNWGYQLGDGTAYGISGWGNNEQEYYREENSSVEDGFLYIEAKLEEYMSKPYTSSKLVSKDKFSQTFGRFEARIRLPLGDGLWPAFWLMPEDNVYGGWARSGEIDIMEAKGRLQFDASGALHYGNNWPNNVYQSGHTTFEINEGIDTFHVYAVEWTAESIQWYFDDELVFEVDDWYSEGHEFPAPFDQDFYMILNLAVGGNFDGNRLPNDSIFNSRVTMVVDYVRVFQFDE